MPTDCKEKVRAKTATSKKKVDQRILPTKIHQLVLNNNCSPSEDNEPETLSKSYAIEIRLGIPCKDVFDPVKISV